MARREALLSGQARGHSIWPGVRPFSVVRRGDPLVVRCKPCKEMCGNVANFIILITISYFCCCELNQISKRPNSGVSEGMGGVGSFLVEITPLFNLSHGRKCPFGSLAVPAQNQAQNNILCVNSGNSPDQALL